MPCYVIGIDPGQSADPTALALLEYEPAPKRCYLLRGLHTFPLGTPYTELPTVLETRLAQQPLAGHTMVSIDATGVGAPVIDYVRERLPTVPVYGITITGGTAITGTHKNPHVPKRDLISTSALILEQRHLEIAENMRQTETLTDELLAYRRATTDRGTDKYDAAAGSHDDLVLALSLALWTAEHRQPVRPRGRTTSSPARHRIPGVREDRFPIRHR